MQLTSAEISAVNQKTAAHHAAVETRSTRSTQSKKNASAAAAGATSTSSGVLVRLNTAGSTGILPFPFGAVQLVMHSRSTSARGTATVRLYLTSAARENAYLTVMAQERAAVNTYLTAQAERHAAVDAYLSAVARRQTALRAYLAAVAPRPAAPAPVPAPAPAPGPAAGSPWAALRQCESSGNYADDTGNGYYGAYQFTAGTWASLGFHGLPSQASAAEQDQAAQELEARRGWGQWPSCARRLGLL